MNPREFVETRSKRAMAQTLQELEDRVETPLRRLADEGTPPTAQQLRELLYDIELVKRTFRKRIQALASDCLDLMPDHIQINAFEPIGRR